MKTRLITSLVLLLFPVATAFAQAVDGPYLVNPDGTVGSEIRTVNSGDERLRVTYTGVFDEPAVQWSGAGETGTFGAATFSEGQVDLDLGSEALATGRYRMRIAGSDGAVSNAFIVVVASAQAPTVTVRTDPQGRITDPKPVFEITRPAGVLGTIIGLSSTPFTFEEDEAGEVSFLGATLSWVIHTLDDEAQYGAVPDGEPFFADELPAFSSPPLITDSTYYYAAFNTYNPGGGEVSTVFGGIQTFVFEGETLLSKPVLVSPANDSTALGAAAFSGTDVSVTFEWEPVPGPVGTVARYLWTLYRCEDFAGDSSPGATADQCGPGEFLVPVDSKELPGTQVSLEYNALQLTSGRYFWDVSAFDQSEQGLTSDRRNFNFELPTGKIRFTVRDEAGNTPRDGQRIVSGQGSFLPTLTRGTLGDDEFEVPPGTYRFTCNANGYLPGEIFVQGDTSTSPTVTVQVGEQIDAQCLLPRPGSAFNVSVEDATTGLEIANSYVVACDASDPSSCVFGFEERGPEARFGYRSVDAGRDVRLLAAAPGYSSRAEQRRVPLQQNPDGGTLERNVSLKLVNRAATLSGQVVSPEGLPIPGVRIIAYQAPDLPNMPRLEISNKTDSDGNFSFVLTGDVELRVISEAYYSDPFTTTLTAGEERTGVQLQVDRSPHVLNVTLLFGGFRVERGQATVTPDAGSPYVESIVNGSAQFVLPAEAATYTVEVTETVTGRDLTAEPQTITLGSLGKTTGLVFALEPIFSTVSGAVTLPPTTELQTDPVSGDDVFVEVPGTPLDRADVVLQRFVRRANGSGYWSWNLQRAKTNQAGAFSFDVAALGATNYRIWASFAGHAPEQPFIPVTLNTEQNIEGLQYIMNAGASSVGGTVKDQDGQTIADAQVLLTSEVGSKAQSLETSTDANGTYTLNVTAGTWRIAADKVLYRSSLADSLTLAAGTNAVQDLTIEDLTTIFEGNAFLKDVEITATLIQRDDNDDELEAQAISDAQGNYTLSLLSGYAYNIVARKAGFFTLEITTEILDLDGPASIKYAASKSNNAVPVEVSQTGGVNFQLQRAPASVTGRLVDQAGQLVRNAFVIAYDENGTPFDSTRTASDGSYLLGLNPGSYRLEGIQPGYDANPQSLAVVFGQTLSGYDLSVRQNLATVQGRVTSAGMPVEGALVQLIGRNGGGTVNSQADGSFVLPRMIGETYRVTVTKRGFEAYEADGFTITAGQNARLEVNLPAFTATLRGSIQLADGRPLPGVAVRVTSGAGTVKTAQTNAEGAYLITGLPFGDLLVSASKAGHNRGDDLSVVLTDAQPTQTLDITDFTESTASITGTVQDAATGAPIQGVLVQAEGPGGTNSTFTSTSGSYTLTNMVPGAYDVVATAEGYGETRNPVVAEATQPAQLDLSLAADQARVVGQVLDPAGQPLPFQVRVIMANGVNRYETRSDQAGRFELTDVALGTFTASTAIRAVGYGNVSVGVTVAPGATEIAGVELVVPINQGVVQGAAGTPQARIEVADVVTGDVVGTATSISDGSYVVQSLPVGSFDVRVARLGYVFSPATQRVELGLRGTAEAVFSATPNRGELIVTSRDAEGAPVPNVGLSVVSTDTTFFTTGTTNQAGEARFSLTAGKVYVISPTVEGVSVSPSVAEQALAAGQTATVAFTVVEGRASIAGTIRQNGGSVLPGATVAARDAATGATFRTIQASGSYILADLPAATYSVIAALPGYRADTTQVTVAAGQPLTEVDFALQPLSVRIQGQVLLKGAGVAGRTVVASGQVEQRAVTDAAGRFVLSGLPIATAQGDTSVYELRLEDAGLAGLRQAVTLTPDQAGRTIAVPDIVLPSGSVLVTVTDGVQPVPGAQVVVAPLAGASITGQTGGGGEFQTAEGLSRGTYRVAATQEGRMRPSSPVLVTLPDNAASATTTLALPYTFAPPTEVRASDASPLAITATEGYPLTGATATLHYRTASSGTFTVLPLEQVGASFTGAIPSLFVLEDLVYFTEVEDPGSGLTYRSVERTVTPSAAGILTTARVTPDLSSGGVLRVGDTYTLQLVLRDGIGESLASDFTGGSPAGQVTWSSTAQGLTLAQPDPSDPTRITVSSSQAAGATIRISAQLGGATITRALALTFVDAPIAALSVRPAQTRISNETTNLRLEYTALTEADRSIRLGSSLQWAVSPDGIGTVSPDGRLTLNDPQFFGDIEVVATDALSNLSTPTPLSVYAEVDGRAPRQLTNRNGFSLTLQENAVPFATRLSLQQVRIPEPRRYGTSATDGNTYQAADPVYQLSYQADRSLPGDSLQVGATVGLPRPEQAGAQDERLRVGYYDFETVQWFSLAAEATTTQVTAPRIHRFGQYAVLLQNDPLGLDQVAVMPNPFSPQVSPLRLGYYLSTTAPPATVDIRIYNLRGELVRNLLRADVQNPGRYGSRSSLKELTWDGLTDDGRMSRNGRYIIQIKVQDTTGEMTKLVPVVLVK
ncbi:MAG: carboxypeptidase-like regulatory domain-containing protein [Bacteroidota bacterium]